MTTFNLNKVALFDELLKKLRKKDNIEHNKIIINFISQKGWTTFATYYYGFYTSQDNLKEKLYREFC